MTVIGCLWSVAVPLFAQTIKRTTFREPSACDAADQIIEKQALIRKEGEEVQDEGRGGDDNI